MKDLVLFALRNPLLVDPKMYFPLGILYIAAVAQRAGAEVQIIDMRDGVWKGDIPDAKYYGFSCTTPEIDHAKEWAERLEGETIVGGAHPSALPEDCTNHFDYTVVGEGEDIILEILAGRGNQLMIARDRIRNLDNVPYPAWDLADCFSDTLFPGWGYGRGFKAMTVIASRGCPFNCAFCGNLHRKPVVYRSVNNILGELEELKKRGVYYFRFEDDNFTLHPDFDNLCLEIGELGIHYKCHMRSKLLTTEQAGLMEWSGCEECGLGVESADDIVLERNNKRETTKDHARAIEILHRAGLRAKTYFVAGLPGETDDTLKLNQEFMRQTKPDKWTLSTFTPYPGSDIYKHPEKYGVKILDWNFSNWWNFVHQGDGSYVYQLESEPPGKTWERFNIFNTWLKGEEWKTKK